MITMRASALIQISASFSTAEANVISGTKNTKTCLITTIAKSEMASPAQVAGEKFLGKEGRFGMRGKGGPMVSVFICFIEMLFDTAFLLKKKKGVSHPARFI